MTLEAEKFRSVCTGSFLINDSPKSEGVKKVKVKVKNDGKRWEEKLWKSIFQSDDFMLGMAHKIIVNRQQFDLRIRSLNLLLFIAWLFAFLACHERLKKHRKMFAPWHFRHCLPPRETFKRTNTHTRTQKLKHPESEKRWKLGWGARGRQGGKFSRKRCSWAWIGRRRKWLLARSSSSLTMFYAYKNVWPFYLLRPTISPRATFTPRTIHSSSFLHPAALLKVEQKKIIFWKDIFE